MPHASDKGVGFVTVAGVFGFPGTTPPPDNLHVTLQNIFAIDFAPRGSLAWAYVRETRRTYMLHITYYFWYFALRVAG
jgi:hypothetical protein